MISSVAEELRIPLRYLTLAAKAWGKPSAPPMLALHGWLDNAGTFDRLAPLLEGHYLVALDLAGHGRSQHRPPANWYPYADFLDDIAAVIDWFGWSNADLLGHSLGATLASTFAAICPQKVRRLLLIEGLGPLTQEAGKTLEQLRRAHSARAAFTGEGLRVFATIEDAIDARCRSGHLSKEAARCIVERGLRPADIRHASAGSFARLGNMSNNKSSDSHSRLDEFQGMATFESKSGDSHSRLEEFQALPNLSWSSDPQLTVASPSRLTELQLAAVLPAITASTLLVLAEPHAPYLQPEMMEARIALVPDIEVVRLPGTHHLHLEDPQPVASAMRAFLQANPVDGSGNANPLQGA